MEKKTLCNTDVSGAKKNVSDIKFFGPECPFKLLSKAWSENEGWMKATKALAVPDLGVIIQVTTQQQNPDGTYAVAEALCYVPGACIQEQTDEEGNVVGRELAALHFVGDPKIEDDE